jgi:hypothetical protein
MNRDDVTNFYTKGSFQGDKHREPGKHARGMSVRDGGKPDVLVEDTVECPRESVD